MKIKSKNYNYEPIGQRIKTARLKTGYTQAKLADALDVSCQHISDIERGLNGMSIPALMDICAILDVDADYVLFGMATRPQNNPINAILGKMTSEQRTHAEEILMAYARSCGLQ